MTDQRSLFEHWISKPPFEMSVDRYPDDPDSLAWPGGYKNYPVELAWVAWKAATKNTNETHQAAINRLRRELGLNELVRLLLNGMVEQDGENPTHAAGMITESVVDAVMDVWKQESER